MSRVVELFGVPGVGKSTLAAAIATALDGVTGLPAVDLRSIHAAGTSARVTAAARAVGRSPASTATVVAALARSNQGSAGQFARRALGWAAAQTAIAEAPADRVQVFDEGVLQVLWSVGWAGDARPVLDALERTTWLRPDRVVVLDEPVEVVLDRLEGRTSSHSRIDRVEPGERARHLAAGTRRVHALTAWLREHAPAVDVVTTGAVPAMSADRAARLVGLAHSIGSA